MNEPFFDFADMLLLWAVFSFLYLILFQYSLRLLRGRIRAQNEEIVRLSRIIDGYRQGAKQRVVEQYTPDWPKFL